MAAGGHPRSRARARLRIGTSGFQYRSWRARFYPPKLPQAQWLEFYARHFDTVEINNTFYNLPAASVFERWAERVPRGFCFAVKYSRFATHYKRLLDPAPPLELFLERARRMGAKLGPVLVQLPPRWNADPERLEAFLDAAPRDVRWAIEVRDESWLNEDVYACLRRHGAALCVHDKLPHHPEVDTADFAYWRFHGTDGRYGGSYPTPHLAAVARKLRRSLRDGLDVFAYFNNDVDGHAWFDAGWLAQRLGAEPPDRAQPEP
jgi:uncharacterized protein YecE (DUF72 family)